MADETTAIDVALIGAALDAVRFRQKEWRAYAEAERVLAMAMPEIGKLATLDKRVAAATTRGEVAEQAADAREVAASARATKTERDCAARVEKATTAADEAEQRLAQRRAELEQVERQVRDAEGKRDELRAVLR